MTIYFPLSHFSFSFNQLLTFIAILIETMSSEPTKANVGILEPANSDGDNADGKVQEKSQSQAQAQLDPDAIIHELSSSECKITQSDLLVAAKVLSAISKIHPKHKPKDSKKKRTRDESLKIYQSKTLRPIRKALAGCFELHKMQMYEGKSEEQHFADLAIQRSLKRQKLAEREQQKKYIANTELRSGRIKKLEKLKMDSKEEEENRLQMQALMIPDGHVDTEDISCNNIKMIGNGHANECENAKPDEDSGIKLPKLRSCYVCKVRYRDLHPFYDQLCPPCAKLNYEKRHFKVDMEGKVAVVTGSRVKIGYQVCLKLLRSGCKVLATTRFPNSAAATYRKEKDFNEWKDNLSIYGLDLRDVVGLEAFTRFLKMKFGEQGIDVLVNNACQTVRRPAMYYKPIVENETKLWEGADSNHKNLLSGCMEFETLRRKLLVDQKQQQQLTGSDNRSSSAATIGIGVSVQPHLPLEVSQGTDADITMVEAASDDEEKKQECVKPQAPSDTDKAIIEKAEQTNTASSVVERENVTAPFESTGLSHSAAMSQMVILQDDVGVSPDILPPGLSDVNGHQLDLRQTNSWLLKMDEVSTVS